MSDTNLFLENDPFSPIRYTYGVSQRLHREHSGIQDIEVIENPYFGRMLLLDGVVQLSERDEFFYHELLVHVPLHAHGQPERVLIVGGGDGGSLREVLKYPSIREALVVEIDLRVVEVSKTFFPTLSSGYVDSRTRLIQEDGYKFLEFVHDPFDVIIIDSTDPVGAAEGLYSLAFLERASQALTSNGLLVIQSESLHFHRQFVLEVQERLRKVFPIVDLYTQSIATYAGNWWSFSIGSKLLDPRVVREESALRNRYYSPDMHSWAFLPKSLHARLVEGKLIW